MTDREANRRAPEGPRHAHQRYAGPSAWPCAGAVARSTRGWPFVLIVLASLLLACAFTGTAQATYDPNLGRWLERDPAGYVDGGSAYHYGRSNPIELNDYFGLAANKIEKIIAVFHGQDFFGLDGGVARGAMEPLMRKLRNIRGASVGGPFSEDSDNSNKIIRWFEQERASAAKGGVCDPLMYLVGHSNGGDAARKIAVKKFPRERWTVRILATIDPVEKPLHDHSSFRWVGSYTREWVNYYQRDDTFSYRVFGEFRLQGYRLFGAGIINNAFGNIQMSYPPASRGPHTRIATDPRVTDGIANRIRNSR